MHRSTLRLLALAGALTSCYAADPSDAGTPDVSELSDARIDAPFDGSIDASAGRDVPGTDVPGRDAPAPDGGRDAPLPFDAGPGGAAAVDAALDLLCGLPAYAACTAPWACGCDTRGALPPPDVAACERRERSTCETTERPRVADFFARSGVTVDEAALAACLDAARRSYDLCLPRPVLAEDLPASCWDAFVLGVPSGGACEVSGMRCADGAGVCAGRACTLTGADVGARCSATCTAGLACVRGTCARPSAGGGPCGDHEDCAPPELCVGGLCAPPAPSGAACTDRDRCATGLTCEGASCRSAGGGLCVVGGLDVCPSGTECRGGFVNVCQPRLGVGETCSGEECALGLECDFSSSFPGVCRSLPRIGDPCNARCADGLVCVGDFFGATCEAPRPLGDPCAGVSVRDGSICEAGLGCVGGVCGALPRLDEPCSDDGRCERGLACGFDPVTFEQRCQVPLPEGADCGSRGGDCAEGLFCDFAEFPALCRVTPGEGQECPSGLCAAELECRFFAPLSRSICVPPASLGQECQSLCAGDAFCALDPSAGTCVIQICDWVSADGGPGPIPF